MNAARIIMIVLFSMDLGINLVKHKEKKDATYNFWTSLISTIIMVVILYFGGFWG